MSEPASSRPAPADASAVSEEAAASVLSAAARSWPGAALAIGAGGRVLSASPLSGFLEGMRAPFDLPVAPIAVADRRYRRPPLARLRAGRRRSPRHRRPQGRTRRRASLHRRRQPRDPHAAQRHSRHGRAARGGRALASAARLCHRHPQIRRAPARPAQQRARLLAHGGGRHSARRGAVRSGRPRAGCRRTAGAARARRRPRHRRHRRSRPAGADDRRRGAPAADPVQPRRQRHQVHREGRRADRGAPRATMAPA